MPCITPFNCFCMSTKFTSHPASHGSKCLRRPLSRAGNKKFRQGSSGTGISHFLEAFCRNPYDIAGSFTLAYRTWLAHHIYMSHIARSSHGPSGAKAFAGADLQPHDDCGNFYFLTIIFILQGFCIEPPSLNLQLYVHKYSITLNKNCAR